MRSPRGYLHFQGRPKAKKKRMWSFKTKRIITLLTDFGHTDEYVGVMKGVILSIAPEAIIIDLNHMVDPQDIIQAAYLLKASYPYFPKNTIHAIVVDPGVGTERKIVALKIDGHFFLAPDNGVLSLLWQHKPIEAGVWVRNSRYFLRNISRTFHGRDIIAPVAAWLSQKISITHLGTAVKESDLKKIHFQNANALSDNAFEGRVIAIDRFGNLLTNIEAKTISRLCRLNPDKLPVVKIGNVDIMGLSNSYQSVSEKEPLMIIGSRGFLEIAIHCGNAGQMLNVRKGDPVVLSWQLHDNVKLI